MKLESNRYLWLKLLLIFSLVNTTWLSAQTGTYLEENGLVIMEMENTPSEMGEWLLDNNVGGYTSHGYLEFTGNNLQSGPPNSPLEYNFKIEKSGLYYLHMHCARENAVINGEARTDVANDAYIRVDGDYGPGPNVGNKHGDNAPLNVLKSNTKFFGGSHNNFVWASGNRLDLGGHNNKRVALYNFKSGENYKLVIHGRSKLFKVNRIVFRHQDVGVNVAQNVNLPESDRENTDDEQGQTYSFKATSDFPNISVGAVNYYIDSVNNALAINASVVNNRNKFAKARATFNGISGVYNVRITTVIEEDGESIYRLKINGTTVRTFQNPYIGPGSSSDLQPHTHTWNNVTLENGDIIEIESNTHTNGEITEGNGTAWARGRWRQIDFFTGNAPTRFDKAKDILIAQFDSRPDADDIHAQAALGSFLAHPDADGVNFYAVAGAYGIQGGKYINSTTLFNMAFGEKNTFWTDAHNDRSGSVIRIRNKVRPILENGGKVWVQEAGQSNITADWIKALLDAGVPDSIVKNNIIVVQHSDWNESKTDSADLNYVKNNATYQSLDDGNDDMGTGPDRGPNTPNYQSSKTATQYLISSKSSSNPNTHSRNLWREADQIVINSGFKEKDPDYSPIPENGVDFSDCVEIWWIFELGTEVDTIDKFWDRYVINDENDGNDDFLTITDDAYLQNGNNFNSNILRVEGGNRISYIKFNVTNASRIEAATLSLIVQGDPGQGTIRLFEGSHSNWTESNLSSNNAPVKGSQLSSANKTFPEGTTHIFDISNLVKTNGAKTIIVEMDTGGNDVSFGSTEGSAKPKIEVTLKPEIQMAVTNFNLINADTDTVVKTLTNGTVINKVALNSFSAQALTQGTIGSVVFELNGDVEQIENRAVYSVSGNTGNNYFDWSLTPGDYTLKATPYTGTNGSGNSGQSLSIQFTVIESTLPSGQNTNDIGNVAFKTLAVYENNTYLISASGTDIWGNNDSFGFVNQDAEGDIEVIANLLSIDNTHPWAKAGVMIRESLDADSKHAMTVITPGQGASFQRRISSGENSFNTNYKGIEAPEFVKILRSGNKFTGYYSPDKKVWFPMMSANISMGLNVKVGLVVTSHDNTQETEAVISDFTIKGSADTLAVTRFFLVNADTNEDIRELYHNDTINLAVDGINLSVRAEATGAEKSVIIDLDGVQQTENVAPYALKGDQSGNYTAWSPALGSYTILATPFSEQSGSGLAGDSLAIVVNVVNE